MALSIEVPESQRARVYVSYPMTRATEEDLALRRRFRKVVKNELSRAIQFYDPEVDEPANAVLRDLQALDWKKLRESDAILFLIGPGTDTSDGQKAEMEWARRAARGGMPMPGVLWWPIGTGACLTGWTQETCNYWPILELGSEVVAYFKGMVGQLERAHGVFRETGEWGA